MNAIIGVLVALLLEGVSAAKILALMLTVSHSHHLWNAKYLEALAGRGHDITYFSVDRFLSPPKNVREIFVEGAYEVYDGIDFSEIGTQGPYRSIALLYQWIEEESALVVQSKGFAELQEVTRREKFDLVVHDFASCWFLLGAVDLLGRPPIMAMTAFGIPSLALTVLGNPLAYSSKPHFLSHYSNTMTLLQRADNFFLHLWSHAVEWVHLRKQNHLAKTSFGPNIRPLEQILDDINIILVNSNHAIDFPFPKVPGLIPVGGLHIHKPKPLPQDLKAFLDEASHGVVYFSLGSNINSSMLATKHVDIFMEAFTQIAPVRVLWKWESDALPKQPSNVRTGKWFPQNDVLAHPNVRVFFTHCGLLSTQEAIYHGKPIVGMPFFLDQHVNVNNCVRRRLGEKLHLNSLTVEDVVAVIGRVLGDPQYAENARNASLIFKDESQHPLDRAIFWTEYAIRHKGAPHLRHSSRNLSWCQNWMLDVLILTISLAFLLSFCTCKLAAIVAAASPSRQRRKSRANKND